MREDINMRMKTELPHFLISMVMSVINHRLHIRSEYEYNNLASLKLLKGSEKFALLPSRS